MWDHAWISELQGALTTSKPSEEKELTTLGNFWAASISSPRQMPSLPASFSVESAATSDGNA